MAVLLGVSVTTRDSGANSWTTVSAFWDSVDQTVLSWVLMSVPFRADVEGLPAGVRGVSGTFGRGDPVEICGPDGQIGIGLVRYTAVEADAIAGQRSDRIEAILGYPGRAALIHRDDMAL